jgi:hypothetical protein
MKIVDRTNERSMERFMLFDIKGYMIKLQNHSQKVQN